MRFAITGIDRYLGVFEALLRAGWQPVKLFTVPIRQPAREGNDAMIALAENHGAAVQVSRMSERDVQELQALGCEALIVASYKWRIGDWPPYLKYAVNFHASPLPEARGPYPAVRAILEQRRSWAVTCHKIAREFDCGDILAAQDFPMTADECHESLDLKTQIAARRLATRIAENFVPLWQAATPQGPGTYWPMWKTIDRAIDFAQPVEAILRHIRAFGLIESLAFVNHRWLTVHRATGWQEANGPAPGTVVHVDNRTIVVAVRDGYIGLIEWMFTPDETLAELPVA